MAFDAPSVFVRSRPSCDVPGAIASRKRRCSASTSAGGYGIRGSWSAALANIGDRRCRCPAKRRGLRRPARSRLVRPFPSQSAYFVVCADVVRSLVDRSRTWRQSSSNLASMILPSTRWHPPLRGRRRRSRSRCPARRQHHQPEDRARRNRRAALRDGDLGVEAGRELDELRGGAGMQAAPVGDHSVQLRMLPSRRNRPCPSSDLLLSKESGGDIDVFAAGFLGALRRFLEQFSV